MHTDHGMKERDTKKTSRFGDPSEQKLTHASKRPREDDADAFIRDPDEQPRHTNVDLAESLAESFVHAATTGEDTADELFLESNVEEEIGGPFVNTSAGEEIAYDDDGMPADTEPSPRPQAHRSLSLPPGSDVEPAPAPPAPAKAKGKAQRKPS